MRMVLLAQLLSTLALFGLIWFVQIVHYPLFASVGQTDFRTYAAAHATRTTWIVAPLMLLEVGSALLLLEPSLRPMFICPQEAWLGLIFVAVIWSSTALLQVPLHNRLQTSFSGSSARRLVATNWVRTIAWTVRAALVLTWVSRLLPR